MATLYEISSEILGCVDPETGEIIDEEKLERLNMEFDQKVENVALWIKNLLADAASIKAEADALTSRRKVYENQANRLKEYLSKYLGGQKFSTPRVSISYRKSETVDVADINDVPKEFLRYADPEADKVKIKEALKAGKKLKGCRLVEKQNLQIR